MLADLETELADECPFFTWNGTNWPILAGGGKFKRANTIGGLELTNDLQLTVLTGQFAGTLPDSGQTFIHDGQTFRIVAVTLAPAGFQMRINADLVVQGM